MHNLTAAVALVQLREYEPRMAEIDRAMNYFWDLLDGVPGIRAHRPPVGSGSTMGGWYVPHGVYYPPELSYLPQDRYAEAVRAEGFDTWTLNCIKNPLHLHAFFHDADVYRDGRPRMIAHTDTDWRMTSGSLPNAEGIGALTVPGFRRFDQQIIEQYAEYS